MIRETTRETAFNNIKKMTLNSASLTSILADKFMVFQEAADKAWLELKEAEENQSMYS